MIIDLIELPNRYSIADEELTTILPHFSNDNLENIDWYGRKVPLSPFADERVKKYKLIEVDGSNTLERVFLTTDEVDTTKKFWTSTQRVYPIQTKTFSMADPLYGTTVKYVNGIKDFHLEQFDNQLYPAVLDKVPIANEDVWFHSPYSVVIPSLDLSIIDPESRLPMQPNVGKLDNWISPQLTLNKVTQKVDSRFNGRQGLAVQSTIEYPFIAEEEMCNIDPINCCWAMYELISTINDLAVSDMRITANAYENKIDVVLSSRYSGLFDYSHIPGYEELCLKLKRLTEKMIRDRFNEVAWTQIVIEKLWSEEIYIIANIQCPGRSSTIPTYYYIDLPIFVLGTVGMN